MCMCMCMDVYMDGCVCISILIGGRVLGGIATSILFSSFESWMVHEHHEQGYPEEWLGMTFAVCTSGNGIVAIASGVIASFVRENFGPGMDPSPPPPPPPPPPPISISR